MATNTVVIDKDKYEKLLDAQQFLECLQTAGVDNWDGYEIAQQVQAELKAEEARLREDPGES